MQGAIMKNVLLGGLAVAGVAMVSCVQQAVQPQPVPTGYEAKIKAYHLPLLKDPLGAQYQFTSGPYLKKTGYGMLYHVDYLQNSKNSYGGYTGFTPHRAAFLNGVVKFDLEKGEYGLYL